MDFKDLVFPVLSIGGLGILFGLVLGYASKKFAVPVDEKVPLIKDSLPGANCGGCGYAGCEAYAQAVAAGLAPVDLCSVGGAAVAAKVAEIMGQTADANAEPLKAYVKCNGTCSNAKQKGIYYGATDCKDAMVVPGDGAKACAYGCMGLGSCVKACKFDAMDIVDGIAVVDSDNCVGCGACVKACPKSIIEMKPLSHVIRAACNSRDKLKEVKDVCNVGCITCLICAKNCPVEAITFVNNLPVIDANKCTQCMTCVQKCPTKAMIAYRK